MKIYFNQLRNELNKSLQSLYLISGDEPLQKMEAADMIREEAYTQGFESRRLFFADAKFDWEELFVATDNLSLFESKQLFEVIIVNDKLDTKAKQVIESFADNPVDNTVLIIRCGKIDVRTKWGKKIATDSVLILIYPKNAIEIVGWIRERILRANLKVENQVVELIAERVEGNMLVAAQEIEKLKLLHGDGVVQQESAEKSIGDSARFNIYDLADAAITSNTKRALHVLRGLKNENFALPLLLWSLTTQIRKMIQLEQSILNGKSMDAILRSEWRSKQETIRKALARRLGIHRWQTMLYWCGETEKVIKGISADDAWNEMNRLVLRICGKKVLVRKISAC